MDETPTTPKDGEYSPTQAELLGQSPPNKYRVTKRLEHPWGYLFLDEIPDDPTIPWIWEDYLAPGCVTLLSGYPKAGKTTLVSHLLREMGRGGRLITPVRPARTLIVSEEPRMLWKRRWKEMDLQPQSLAVTRRPFKARPSPGEWMAYLEFLAALVAKDAFQVIVFDPIACFWPVVDENSASDVLAALAPLRQLTEAGAALLLIHHCRKSGGVSGTAARGSSAFGGEVDIITELDYYDHDSKTDQRRRFTAHSRVSCPDEVILELQDDHYTCLGTKTDDVLGSRLEIIESILTAARMAQDLRGMTRREIATQWPAGQVVRPGDTKLKEILAIAEERGLVIHTGTGVGKSPFRYHLPSESPPADRGDS